MEKNRKGRCYWEKLKFTNVFSFNSGFFRGGVMAGVDVWEWMHSLSYGIKGSSESYYEHTTVQWMTRWPFLGKGKKEILFSGSKTYQCISLLFLSYTKFIHVKEEHYSPIRERRRKARKKIENFSENFSLDKQGTHFYLQKVKVTRLVFTVSLYGTKEYTTKPVAHVSQLAAGLKMVEFNWLWRMNYPYVWTKKPSTWSHQARSTTTFQAQCVTAHKKANFNLFCTFEHTQKPIWFSLK